MTTIDLLATYNKELDAAVKARNDAFDHACKTPPGPVVYLGSKKHAAHVKKVHELSEKTLALYCIREGPILPIGQQDTKTGKGATPAEVEELEMLGDILDNNCRNHDDARFKLTQRINRDRAKGECSVGLFKLRTLLDTYPYIPETPHRIDNNRTLLELLPKVVGLKVSKMTPMNPPPASKVLTSGYLFKDYGTHAAASEIMVQRKPDFTMYGLHTYGGMRNCLRPDLGEVFHLLLRKTDKRTLQRAKWIVCHTDSAGDTVDENFYVGTFDRQMCITRVWLIKGETVSSASPTSSASSLKSSE